MAHGKHPCLYWKVMDGDIMDGTGPLDIQSSGKPSKWYVSGVKSNPLAIVLYNMV